jgi:hypothetical protein
MVSALAVIRRPRLSVPPDFPKYVYADLDADAKIRWWAGAGKTSRGLLARLTSDLSIIVPTFWRDDGPC